ncbi:NELL2-interacting cell ontogeny regulator 1-like [Pelodytes ibericus]
MADVSNYGTPKSTPQMLSMVPLGVTVLLCWVAECTPMSTLKDNAAPSESGSVIPAETRPCVDCHAFEFMQRAVEDIRKAAYSLDSQTETLLLKTEERALCYCLSRSP